MSDLALQHVISSVSLEPAGTGRYRLVVDLKTDDIIQLFQQLGPLLEPIANARTTKKANEDAKLKAESNERFRIAREKGHKLHHRIIELTNEGLSTKAAQNKTATEFGISVFNLKTCLQLYRIQKNQNQKPAILEAVKEGLSYRKIAKDFEVSHTAVTKIVKEAGLKIKHKRGAK
ncbi:hypothetical protein [Kiloniella antarctica]|uniref:Resolvase HTH domain-containing protein n=1 Tax=Kiloniella antarctica TaxID=1550907 RepID=A0ABW5BGJ8_9PROT